MMSSNSISLQILLEKKNSFLKACFIIFMKNIVIELCSETLRSTWFETQTLSDEDKDELSFIISFWSLYIVYIYKNQSDDK